MSEIVRDMSDAEIQQITDLMLQNKPIGEWKADLPRLTAQIQSLEQQFWSLGEQIVQTRRIILCAKIMEDK